MFGIPLNSEFKYADFLALVHPEDRDRVDSVVGSVLDPSGTGAYDLEYRIVQPGGEIRSVAAKGRAFFREEEGVPKTFRFLGTLLDRTEQKRAQEALIQSERLAVTGRLAASIAHEIRNPLDSIANSLYLLRGESSPTKREEYLSAAESELARVSDIASHTLRFYRDPVGSTEVDLAEMIESTVALFQGRISASGIRIERNLPEGLSIEGTAGEIRQVVANLISNALDAMPRGGRLLLRARPSGANTNTHRNVRLTIADSGYGMTAVVQERIFQPFYSTKGEHGNGLGLWLSLEILKKHHAILKLKSSPSRGTVFVISFSSNNNASMS
jgi:signal transduction histidine kinase